MDEHFKIWLHGFLLTLIMLVVAFVFGLLGLSFLAVAEQTTPLILIGWGIIYMVVFPYVFGWVSQQVSEWLKD